MRRLMLLLATATILITQGAAEPVVSQPWDVATISKSDSHRHAKVETGDTAGPLKYLHLEVKFAPDTADRKLHKFRVVDGSGKTVGEMFGADPNKSLLVFERETPWASLDGLYLDGQGRRVPLFVRKPVKPAPTTVVQPAPIPDFVEPAPPAYVPPRPENVVRVPVTPTHVPPRETVIVDGPDERVVVHGDRVIHDGPDVVVHEGGTANRVVHHYGGGGGGVAVGHGHGHGGGAGVGVGTGSGGCPYGADCPICGKGSEDSLEGLNPWAFDEMGQGRYDDLLARIENSSPALNLDMPAVGSGSSSGSGSAASGSGGAGSGRGVGPAGAGGMGAGAGSGLGIGQGAGPLPGMAAAGSGRGSGSGLPGMGAGSGSGEGAGTGPGQGAAAGQGQGSGQGQGTGQVQGQGSGQGQGPGSGMGAGEGQGPGAGEGQGPGPEDGYGPGPEERFANAGQGGPGQGSGMGPGAMAGPTEGAPSEPAPIEPIPGQNPMNMNNPMNAMAANGAGGGGGGMGMTGPNNVIGPRYVNTADGPRVRVHDIGPDIDLPERTGPVIDVYRPVVPYFDPRFRFDPRIGQMGYGYGYGGGGGGGGGYGAGQGAYAALARTGLPELPELPELMPEIVLYISTGNEGEEGGKIYQVNDAGRVLGIVKLPYQATGLALHRNNGLIAVTPRDRGKIYRVDDTGVLSVIMENNSRLPQPVDVGVAGDSDMILVADSMADVLAATNIAGVDPVIFRRLEQARYENQNMSVAVTQDKHVMFGTDAQRGIYRFNSEDKAESLAPVLAGSGGVAADPKSLKWAATQSPNMIHLYEGGMFLKTFKLAPGKSVYRQGLLSFAPSGAVVVATRHSDEVDQEVWLTAYETAEGKEGQIQSLFPWNRERMLDFVVGPRMIWERHSPSTYESKY